MINQIVKMYTNIYSFMLWHKKSASLPYCKRILQRGILRVKQVFFYPFSEVMREKLGQIIGCRIFLPTLRIYVDSKFMTSMNLRWTLKMKQTEIYMHGNSCKRYRVILCRRLTIWLKSEIDLVHSDVSIYPILQITRQIQIGMKSLFIDKI